MRGRARTRGASASPSYTALLRAAMKRKAPKPLLFPSPPRRRGGEGSGEEVRFVCERRRRGTDGASSPAPSPSRGRGGEGLRNMLQRIRHRLRIDWLAEQRGAHLGGQEDRAGDHDQAG